MRPMFLTALILCLALIPVAAAAEDEPAALEPTPEEVGQPVTDPAVPAECSTPTTLQQEQLEPDFLAAAAGCYADCWDGSRAYCSGSYCFAYDSSCPSQRGYCYGSSTGYRYCPPCPSDCPSNFPCSKYEGNSCWKQGTRVDCKDGNFCSFCFCGGGGTWICA